MQKFKIKATGLPFVYLAIHLTLGFLTILCELFQEFMCECSLLFKLLFIKHSSVCLSDAQYYSFKITVCSSLHFVKFLNT